MNQRDTRVLSAYSEKAFLLTAQGYVGAPIIFPLMLLNALRLCPIPETNFPPPARNPSSKSQ